MLALAHPRLQNGNTVSDEDDEEEEMEMKKSPRIDNLKAESFDLNGSISARDRRRQIVSLTLELLSEHFLIPEVIIHWR